MAYSRRDIKAVAEIIADCEVRSIDPSLHPEARASQDRHMSELSNKIWSDQTGLDLTDGENWS